MLNSIVRDAFVTSVTCSSRWVRFHVSQRVDRAECELALLGFFAGAVHVVENPANLRSRKVGIDRQAGFRADSWSSRPRALSSSQKLAVRRSCQTIALYTRLAGRAIPHDGRFALVSNPDRCNRRAVQAGARHRFRRNPRLGRPDFPGGSCSTQPGCRIYLLKTLSAPTRRCFPRGQTTSRANWWCPGRARDVLVLHGCLLRLLIAYIAGTSAPVAFELAARSPQAILFKCLVRPNRPFR